MSVKAFIIAFVAVPAGAVSLITLMVYMQSSPDGFAGGSLTRGIAASILSFGMLIVGIIAFIVGAFIFSPSFESVKKAKK